jgi:energy-coupling factor transporter ATP-binding protein EcfA2
VRLIKAKVSGYKRLAEDCQLNFDADPVCIVGPNAAGKSSFLNALVHLNHDEPFERSERTRLPGGKTGNPVIEGRFVLEPEDLELLQDIPEAAAVRQLLIYKEDNFDEREFLAEPYPARDLSQREAVHHTLTSLKEKGWVEEITLVERLLPQPLSPSTEELVDAALDVIGSKAQKIEDQVDALRVLLERINLLRSEEQNYKRLKAEGKAPENSLSWPRILKRYASLPNDLAALAAYESQDHPNQRVVERLLDRVPKFVKFDDDARRLEAKYDLTGAEPPSGLGIHNFLALAGTSWKQAVEVFQAGDPGWKTVYLEDIATCLRERAALVWGQSDIHVKVDMDGAVLTILLSMEERDFIGLDDHSDGLQQFMALRAFTWKDHQRVKPIVLIDEAELHLHYDAQADLVSVFEEQDEAGKIIYTTHSAGCLPRDLGQGIRAVVPATKEVDGKILQTDRSETVNRFWTKGRGFSPLLLAMGAGAFAFSATQWAVITEGMSDALLLPTLIREATGEERLHYQAVPSFAEATADEITRFDLVAGRVAFLADGDEGGRNHVQRLIDNGIDAEQILFLGDDENSGLSIEDLLVKQVYLKAVNTELSRWHGVEFPPEELPEKGLSKAVEEWCAQQEGRNGKPIQLSKVDIAQHVLDQRSADTKLLAKAPTLRVVHENIMRVFKSAPERLKELHKKALEAEAEEETAVQVEA